MRAKHDHAQKKNKKVASAIYFSLCYILLKHWKQNLSTFISMLKTTLQGKIIILQIALQGDDDV